MPILCACTNSSHHPPPQLSLASNSAPLRAPGPPHAHAIPSRSHAALVHTPAGLGKGGKQIQNCRKAYLQAIQTLVQLANLQTAFITLDEALKTTNRRVNALENVVKPRLENTISYIKVRVGWHGVGTGQRSSTVAACCASAWGHPGCRTMGDCGT